MVHNINNGDKWRPAPSNLSYLCYKVIAFGSWWQGLTYLLRLWRLPHFKFCAIINNIIETLFSKKIVSRIENLTKLITNVTNLVTKTEKKQTNTQWLVSLFCCWKLFCSFFTGFPLVSVLGHSHYFLLEIISTWVSSVNEPRVLLWVTHPNTWINKAYMELLKFSCCSFLCF